jgi:hypothetical protein
MKKQAACSKPCLSPLGRICQVGISEIKTCLIQMFQTWGMPLAIRTDNGEPFGVPTRDVIPILSLWLLAWGIRPLLNRPRRPQDNPKVERNQGTAHRWAEVYQCTSVSQMQTQLDDICDIQVGIYPLTKLGNASRSEVFTGLKQIARPFDQAVFDEKKAYEHLEKAIYPRKVSTAGAITLYNKSFQVGLKHRGKIVCMKFRSTDLSWMAIDYHTTELLKIIPDPRFSRENLFNLTICQ